LTFRLRDDRASNIANAAPKLPLRLHELASRGIRRN
jgi:hypothetical protein